MLALPAPLRRFTLSLGAAALLLGLGGCDKLGQQSGEEQAEGEKGEAVEAQKQGAAKAPDDAAKAPDDAAKAPADSPETLDGCLSECEMAIASDDDKATCRLRCKTSYGAKEGDERSTLLGRYHGCYDGCASKSPTNRATCHKQCAASVVPDTDELAGCKRGCLDELGTCLDPCQSKGKDDRATCHKLCDTNAGKCVAACK